MTIRFYLDADLLGVAKILVQVRADVTYPGDPGGPAPDGSVRPRCLVQPGEKDVDWIGRVTQNGWVIISRDRHIRHRPAERAALGEAGARVLCLDPRHSLNKWQQLELIVTQWRRFEEIADCPGPWLYTVTRTTLRRRAI